LNAEQKRLEENAADGAPWHRWGSYLSERQWGTVREDYSPDGNAWAYLSHEDSRSRAYRWGEDGLFGFSDRHQILCFSIALWNHKDPILKERLFGLTNQQGNHGEDVKEEYFYLDATPSHSYQKALYKYPQSVFPYDELVQENARRTKADPEFELADTGIFRENRFFEVTVEYAKSSPNDLWIRITATNRGPEAAPLTFIPQIWFRNRWSWRPGHAKPVLKANGKFIAVDHSRYGPFALFCDSPADLLFTDNETNSERLFGIPNGGYVKDAFHRAIVNGESAALNPENVGSKAAFRMDCDLAAGESKAIHLRLSPDIKAAVDAGSAKKIFDLRIKEADEFYRELSPGVPMNEAKIQRQAFAGLLWSKQYYHLTVRDWLTGDPLQPPPPPSRLKGRNHQWPHFEAAEIISMPDKWEYPWFAAWDLAFHCIPIALVDPAFAKSQLLLLLREWYTHPNGQIPAYEWAFGDVNPPVHAWSAWRVYTIERRATGKGDRDFLERVFHKLLINFTWWVNRKDPQGNNVFEGGFLGLDNIGVFDRSAPLPSGSHIEQSDGTSWMAMYCLDMLTIALELAKEEPAYEDVASKFLEHFLYIAEAMNNMGSDGVSLWDEVDGFYYDVLLEDGKEVVPLRVRSLVGLIPLLAVANLDPDIETKFPGFWRRMDWFLRHRPEMTDNVASVVEPGVGSRRILSLVNRDRLLRILSRMLDSEEFLSPNGIRSLSRYHLDRPYSLMLNGKSLTVDYEPAESTSGAFGGNSNWRGPIWFPVNYLLVEALQKYGFYYGADLKVELPTNSGNEKYLAQVAAELENRLLSLFHGDGSPGIKYFEYYDGDTGRGLGASHQTGWTALIAKVIQQLFSTDPGAGSIR
jgi:hypothetical protein